MEGEGSFGFNAETGTYEDLMKAGIVDPTKVTRFALQNAASVAGLLMTTEAMVSEKPKKGEPLGVCYVIGKYVLMHLLCEGVIWFRFPELLQSAKEDILG
jgi:hypothetical protein